MSHSCNWCASTRVLVTDRNAYHKVDHTFGPFDLFVCQQCGSLGTCNPPSRERLASFYRQYHANRPEWYRAGSESGALAAQYKFYAGHVLKYMPTSGQTWADIGAGHGEIATVLHQHRPDIAGTTIDIGDRPSGLPMGLSHKSVDFNRVNWRESIEQRFDLVYSVAVWEHVLSPVDFLAQCLRLVSPGGLLVMVTPDFGAPAARLLKKNWPYYQPGEHISVPTLAGAYECARRAGYEIGYSDWQFEVSCKPLWVGYSVSYLLHVLRLKSLARLVPIERAAPLPTGVLSTIVKVSSDHSKNSQTHENSETTSAHGIQLRSQ